jgi:DUF438 domain-containing protein
MASSKITNDKRATITVANYLIDLAGQLTTSENGHPLTVEQENNNELAELLAEYANTLRANHNKPPLQVQPRYSGASI